MSEEDEAAELEGDKVVQEIKDNPTKKRKGKLKMCKDLSNTVAICQSVGFKGFEYAKNNCK